MHAPRFQSVPPAADASMPDQGAQFAALLVQNDRALLRYILTLVPRRDDAEEILQRTAYVLWEKFPEFDMSREFRPWALRFAYFEILNFRKEQARSRLVFREEVLAALAATRVEQDAVLESQRTALRECLKLLDPEAMSLLVRRYCDSATVASLAQEQGQAEKSVYRRLGRLRERIAECVERRLALEMA